MGKRKEEDDKVLREVFGEDYDKESTDKTGKEHSDEDKTTDSNRTTDKHGFFSADDNIHCPRCRHLLKDRHGCPYCGYNGYIPMSEKQTKRIRFILFPIIIVIAVIVIMIIKGAT